MKLFGGDTDTDLIVIAEIGLNHEGDLSRAKRLLRLAKDSGATAAKFQTFNPAIYTRRAEWDLGESGFRALAEVAASIDFPIFSTAVTIDVVPLLAELFPAIKIASRGIRDHDLIRAVASTGKPMILSTGKSDMATVCAAMDAFEEIEGHGEIAVLHCVSAYPAPLIQANLLSIPYMQERLSCPVGWSNHVSGCAACVAVVAMGVPILEIHFTDSRVGAEFRDHELSVTPSEMADFISAAHRIRMGLGKPGKFIQPCESE